MKWKQSAPQHQGRSILSEADKKGDKMYRLVGQRVVLVEREEVTVVGERN